VAGAYGFAEGLDGGAGAVMRDFCGVSELDEFGRVSLGNDGVPLITDGPSNRV
jgi:hypothetical protein